MVRCVKRVRSLWRTAIEIIRGTYVEIDVEVPRTAKLPVADLECDRHFIVLVQFLVEAFSRMRLQYDVVGEDGGEEGGRGHKGGDY